MATLATIGSPVWGISVYGYGVIVEGVTAIRQRMDIAIRTSKGTDPLRPEFGSNVYLYVDAPMNIAVPNIKREILECLSIWVPEIIVTGIRSYLRDLANPVFEITFRLVDDSITQTFVYDPGAGTSSNESISEIIVQAFIPANPDGLRYKFQFDKNGAGVMPFPPLQGFLTIAQMFAFMQTNYSYLGRWFLLSDRIVCYMKADGVQSASLSISTLADITAFQASFPLLSNGQFYQILFTINGVEKQSDLLQTVGDAISWVNANWSQYATWSIQAFVAGLFVGEFSDEFSSEFEVDEPLNGYTLIGYTVVPGVTASLNIIKV